jgi:hypothetical protein
MNFVVKPERRQFSVSHGEYFEHKDGMTRDCFPIRVRGSRAQVVADLRRDHRFAVVLARSTVYDLDFLVAGEPDGRFTDAQVMKIALLYAPMIQAAQRGQVGEH